ncbi:hypothetical protein [Streptomyces corynorhini]|uniref:hypothetical protein n=1 Tax=Streptomyces corynorhini TaxID=2282652 RepID=UPI001314DD8F|nr:hypothetical protein [Streptomyces corynorhini]
MADERDAWLDKHAAERLLRGEPAAVADDDVMARSELLGRALRDITPVTYANSTELPGEEAALAAFRQARTATGGPVRPTAAELPGTVRITRAPRAARPGRDGRPARPVRGRLAAAVAGCALGGMAVAAAAGVMPALFDGGTLRPPANSVSAGTSSGPAPAAESGGAAAVAPSGVPRGSGTGEPSASVSSAAGVTGDGDRTGRSGAAPGATGDSGAAGGGAAGGGAGKAAEVGPDLAIGPDGKHWGRPGPGADAETASWYARTAEACRDYASGAIDTERRRALESATKGSDGAERYCADLLKDSVLGTYRGGGDRNGPRDGDHGGGSGHGGGNGDGDHGWDGDGDGDGDGDSDDGGGGGDGDGGGGDGGDGAPGVHLSPLPNPSSSTQPEPKPKPKPVRKPAPTPTPTPTPTPVAPQAPSAPVSGPPSQDTA